MSAIKLYLAEAKDTKGTWHKIIINNLRDYMRRTSREDVISAINQLTDASLIPFLWEVGLSQELQDLVNKKSMQLSKAIEEGGE